MIEPTIICHVDGQEVTFRDRHWHCQTDHDLQRDLNDAYSLKGELANDVEAEVRLVMAEIGGEVVAVAVPEPIVVALPNAPEGLTQDELNEVGMGQLVEALEGDAAEIPFAEPDAVEVPGDEEPEA